MKRRTLGMLGVAGAAVAAGALAAATCPRGLRRRCLHWGASAEEVARAIPGEEMMDGADLVSTRAITINAAPERIWPWLVQMGSGRGGAYSYDWIENLFGLDMHSADEILPRFQQLSLGDELPLGERAPAMRVAVLRPNEVLGLRSTDGNWLWLFALYPVGAGTRLVSRNVITLPPMGRAGRLAWRWVMEPGSLVMERKMLLGIKARAERAPVAPQLVAT
ncbi:SRPBCC family protein [Luedemannella helvata]|uniref:SRPBCC family protein n=1 Tax=Luedemannella helvata TaxID=349315 RepID=A0ABN2JSB6_9ACTN